MYCKKCGKEINDEAMVCPSCGVATQNFQQNNTPPQIVINNTNTNSNVNTNTNNNGGVGAIGLRPKNKVVAILLCVFLGVLGAHKFYEGKTGMGILYIFTGGLCFIGVICDFVRLLFKPNPYYV